MAKPEVHTTPHPERPFRWINQVCGLQVGPSHRKRDAAVRAGRAIARRARAEHVIHASDGRIFRKNSYGGESRRPDKNR